MSELQDFDAVADDVIESSPCLVEMPAGTGKTQLLVTVAGKLIDRGHSVLVLTHTNTGVAAISARCSKLGIDRRALNISTVSSWAEHVALSYPLTAGCDSMPERAIDKSYFPRCIEGAVKLMESSWFGETVSASYQAVLVDEYQDCSTRQHELIVALAGLVPCTVCFGDHLQRIFDFSGEEFPDWREVKASFPFFDRIKPFPHRWVGRNLALGEWLTFNLREQLDEDGWITSWPRGLKGLCAVKGRSKDARELAGAAYSLARNGGSTLVVCPNLPPNIVVNDAKKLGKHFRYPEEIEGKFILKAANQYFRLKESGELLVWLVDFIKECSSGTSDAFDATAMKALSERRPIERYLKAKARKPYANLLIMVEEFASVPNTEVLHRVGDALYESPAKVFRREAWDETLRVIDECEATGAEPSEALGALRSRTKYSNSRLRGNIVSRTLLVKGLEYENVLVTHVGEKNGKGEHLYSKENLYVAMTRATVNLWVQG